MENFVVTNPGITFCSCIAVRIFFLNAMNKGIAQEYPPVPITKSGLYFLNKLLTWKNDFMILYGNKMFFKILLGDSVLWIPLRSSNSILSFLIDFSFKKVPELGKTKIVCESTLTNIV